MFMKHMCRDIQSRRRADDDDGFETRMKVIMVATSPSTACDTHIVLEFESNAFVLKMRNVLVVLVLVLAAVVATTCNGKIIIVACVPYCVSILASVGVLNKTCNYMFVQVGSLRNQRLRLNCSPLREYCSFGGKFLR